MEDIDSSLDDNTAKKRKLNKKKSEFENYLQVVDLLSIGQSLLMNTHAACNKKANKYVRNAYTSLGQQNKRKRLDIPYTYFSYLHKYS